MESGDIQAKGQKLVAELDCILSACRVNEIGFVPQTVDLHAPDVDPGPPDSPDPPQYDRDAFWFAQGKLAIAFPVLVSLASAAAEAFRLDRRLWTPIPNPRKGEDGRVDVGKKGSGGQLGSDVDGSGGGEVGGMGAGRGEREERLMRWSRVLVLLNSDHATAWNTRKSILLGRLARDGDAVPGGGISEEMWLSEMVLSLRPKSGDTWAHRRWVLQQKASLTSQPITSQDFAHESMLVQRAAERNVMNYRAWSHACRLIPLLSLSQVEEELERSAEWVKGQPADNCGFHYRRCLLERLLSAGTARLVSADTPANSPVASPWKTEEELNTDMIRRFPGREALWTHRRFLFVHACRAGSASSAASEPDRAPPGAPESCLIGVREKEFVARCVAESEEDGTENGSDQRTLAASYRLWCLHVLRDYPAIRHMGGWEYSDESLHKEEAFVRGRLMEVCPWMHKLWSAEF